jgi:hypothetical protein
VKLPTVSRIDWPDARRMVRVATASVHHFDDIAPPSDWALIASAVRRTDPRLAESVGNLDLIPERRRVSDRTGAIMGPFTHVSYDRPSRFSTGRYGVLYAANSIEAALMQTVHQHERFLTATGEPPGWTSTFREVLLNVGADLHDIRDPEFSSWLDGENYAGAQGVAEPLHAAGSDGIVYPSTRWPGGECVALFYPDLASHPQPGRLFDFHWNGQAVDYIRDRASDEVMRVDRN